MENHDKTGSKIHGLVLLVKHSGNNTVHGMKETVKQCLVIKEKLSQVFVNGKNTMAVGDINQLKGHGGSALHGVEISTGRAETTMAAERDKLKLTAVRTAIHGAAKGRIAAVYHFIDIFHLSFSGMEGIFNFFIVVNKDFL